MYTGLAGVYDRLMGDIPYDRFIALWRNSLERTGHKADRVIDMGCGTGSLFASLLQSARLVIGVDPSAEMLARAADKAGHFGQRVHLLQATAAMFQSPVKANGCVAFCDVLSYILTRDELVASLSAIANALLPGGWICFDVHSPYKIKQIGNDLYCDIQDETIAIMKTSISEDEMTVTYDLVLMEQGVEGLYSRHDEQHVQRAYDLATILVALEQAGFREIVVGADFCMDWSRGQQSWIEEKMQRAERWFFFATRE